jgi:hypothetical protein
MIAGHLKFGRSLLVLLAATALSACSGNTDDLRAYMDEVKARPGGRIPPLPDIVPAPSYTYEANGRRSPFVPDTPTVAVNSNPDAVQGPDPNRPREFLEQFPLDTLRRQSHWPELRADHRYFGRTDSVGGNHSGRPRRVFRTPRGGRPERLMPTCAIGSDFYDHDSAQQA